MVNGTNRMIIIVGRNESVSRLSYEAGKNPKVQDYTGSVSASVNGSTRINCLSVVIRTMEQLVEKNIHADNQITTILTLNMITGLIEKGTPLFWLKNGGKKSTGEAVNETELEYWAKFYELYAQLLTDVMFKDVANAAIPKNPRYAITMEQRAIADYVDKTWERIKVTSLEIIEAEDEAL